MLGIPDFALTADTRLCRELRQLGIVTFSQLATKVRILDYGRTANQIDPLAVLHEGRGTCSSKHLLLALAAHDCSRHEVHLAVGIYLMAEANTPGVGAVLASHAVDSIPEAHCYLIAGQERHDFTGLASGLASPFAALLEEHEVVPARLTESKARLHSRALEHWAASTEISLARAWTIREACIFALAKQPQPNLPAASVTGGPA